MARWPWNSGHGAALCLLASCASAPPLPSQLQLQVGAGNEAARAGDFATAVTHYEKALGEDPGSMLVQRNLGLVHVKTANYAKAKSLLLTSLRRYRSDPELLYFLGEASRGLGEFTSALGYYARALRLDPQDTRISKAQAWTLQKLGRLGESLQVVSPLLAKHPQDLQVGLILATVYNKQGKFRDTLGLLQHVDRAGASGGTEPSGETERSLARTLLGDAYVALSDCKRAIQLYTTVLKTRPFLASALTGLARCDLREQRTEAALTRLSQATRSDPDAQDAHYLYAKTLEGKHPEQAIFYYNRFLLLADKDPTWSPQVRLAKEALARLTHPHS